MKLPANVIQFSNGSDTAYKMFADYWKHYRSQNGVTGLDYQKTRTTDDGKVVEISFGEKTDQMNKALKAEIGRVAKINFEDMPLEAWVSNPMVQWATFAVVGAMIDVVLPETLIDTIGMYTDVRTGGYGDSFSFDVTPRDLFVVSKAGRAQRTTEVHKQFKGQKTILPEMRELTVQVSLYRVLAGNESLADFVAKVIRSLESEMTKDVYNTFNTAMGNLINTPAAQALRIAGYAQDDLVSLAQRVTAWNGGQKAIVVGTPLALLNVLPDDNNYRYMLDSEYVKLGYVRTISGYDVMALPQVADWTLPFATLLDDKKIYVVSPSSQKIVKLCLEGAVVSNVTGPYQNANLTQNATVWKSWGAAVVTNAIAGVITLA
jgi:hypothetical protein